MPPSPYYSGPRTTRDHFVERPSIFNRIVANLPSELAVHMQKLWEYWSYNAISTRASRIPQSWRQAQRVFKPWRLLSLPHLLVAIWVVLLLWGERWVFESSVAACDWTKWEKWPKDAMPHHLIFIADPQLIDPHSYPGRPWPLSTFTILHTDNYMKRSYMQLQKALSPDSLLFLGDLFDGGREWKTARGDTEDADSPCAQRPAEELKYLKKWRKWYGEDFWLREYDRFGRIFFKYWNFGDDKPRSERRGRRIIATLPGNHDLGFGANIKIPIRNRFEAYFGEGNRVDVIGNHTFVSIDSVSLSAGASDCPGSETSEITRPVENFLSGVQALKRKAVARELRYQAGSRMESQELHAVEDLNNVDFSNLRRSDPGEGFADFPTILLTHVPLYRDPGTPCGPHRERWPPTPPPGGQTTPVFPDDRNAISITRGYQYQNVLSETDSVRLVSTIGNVVQVFSGDDHDYCEIVHSPKKNNAREITVKSMNWAQGIRRPGFLLLSMWNPVTPHGQPLHSMQTGHGPPSAGARASSTLESHICLLPDQLDIFIRYGIFLAISLLALIGRAILTPILGLSPFVSPPYEYDNELSLLPTSNKNYKREDGEDSYHFSDSSTSSTSSNNVSSMGLAPRPSAVRTRGVSPTKGYGLPPSQARFSMAPIVGSTGYSDSGADKWSRDGDFGSTKTPLHISSRSERISTFLGTIWQEAYHSIWRVAWVVTGVYLWLAWYG